MRNIENIPLSLGFEDVALLQGKNQCLSRMDADISSEVFRGVVRPIPIMAANMLSVVSSEFCVRLYKLGALGIMHRAAPVEFLLDEVAAIAKKCDITCASVGVGEGQFELAVLLIKAGATCIFIDIAHGYCDPVISLGRKIKTYSPSVKVVVGNTINTDMLGEVADFADAIKVGIGNSTVCQTKNTAACNEKQFTTIYKFYELAHHYGIPLIGDGGIRESADFTKAIAGGADSVMAGSIFAMCPESAAEIVETAEGRKKAYAGMASKYTMKRWQKAARPGIVHEGTLRYLEIGESVESLLLRYSGALRSGITYAGARNVEEMHRVAKFVRVR